MNNLESIFYWMTALFFAAAFFVSLIASIFKKQRMFNAGHWFIICGFSSLTVLGIARWIMFDHPPFVTLFESMLTSIWFLVLLYLILRWTSSKFNLLLIPVSLISFLMMGWSASLPKEATPLSAALNNVWLFIHASFATAGASAFLIAASFAIIYLLGKDRIESMSALTSKIPRFESLPRTIFHFSIFGLILWGVMIVSGSIWAHAAWGRYWAWDPIELWSLISWLIYGLLIHARLGFKISQKLSCYLTIIAALIVAFSLWGVGYIYETIHVYG